MIFLQTTLGDLWTLGNTALGKMVLLQKASVNIAIKTGLCEPLCLSIGTNVSIFPN